MAKVCLFSKTLASIRRPFLQTAFNTEKKSIIIHIGYRLEQQLPSETTLKSLFLILPVFLTLFSKITWHIHSSHTTLHLYRSSTENKHFASCLIKIRVFNTFYMHSALQQGQNTYFLQFCMISHALIEELSTSRTFWNVSR